MLIIVDTYNVLHVVGVLPPEIAGVDTAGLIELLARSRYRGRRSRFRSQRTKRATDFSTVPVNIKNGNRSPTLTPNQGGGVIGP